MYVLFWKMNYTVDKKIMLYEQFRVFWVETIFKWIIIVLIIYLTAHLFHLLCLVFCIVWRKHYRDSVITLNSFLK